MTVAGWVCLVKILYRIRKKGTSSATHTDLESEDDAKEDQDDPASSVVNSDGFPHLNEAWIWNLDEKASGHGLEDFPPQTSTESIMEHTDLEKVSVSSDSDGTSEHMGHAEVIQYTTNIDTMIASPIPALPDTASCPFTEQDDQVGDDEERDTDKDYQRSDDGIENETVAATHPTPTSYSFAIIVLHQFMEAIVFANNPDLNEPGAQKINDAESECASTESIPMAVPDTEINPILEPLGAENDTPQQQTNDLMDNPETKIPEAFPIIPESTPDIITDPETEIPETCPIADCTPDPMDDPVFRRFIESLKWDSDPQLATQADDVVPNKNSTDNDKESPSSEVIPLPDHLNWNTSGVDVHVERKPSEAALDWKFDLKNFVRKYKDWNPNWTGPNVEEPNGNPSDDTLPTWKSDMREFVQKYKDWVPDWTEANANKDSDPEHQPPKKTVSFSEHVTVKRIFIEYKWPFVPKSLRRMVEVKVIEDIAPLKGDSAEKPFKHLKLTKKRKSLLKDYYAPTKQ